MVRYPLRLSNLLPALALLGMLFQTSPLVAQEGAVILESAPSSPSPPPLPAPPPPGAADPPRVDLVLPVQGPFPPGGEVPVEVRVTWLGSADAWMVKEVRLPTDEKARVEPGAQRSVAEGGKAWLTFEYHITLPEEPGSYSVGPVEVDIIDPASQEGSTVASSSATVAVGGEGRKKNTGRIVTVAGAMVSILAGIFWVMGKRRQATAAGERLLVLSAMVERAEKEWQEGRMEAFVGCLIGLHTGLQQGGWQPSSDLPSLATLGETLEGLKFGGRRLERGEATTWLEGYRREVLGPPR